MHDFGPLPLERFIYLRVAADLLLCLVFDDGLDEYCYWYPADVGIVDNSWVEYTA